MSSVELPVLFILQFNLFYAVPTLSVFVCQRLFCIDHADLHCRSCQGRSWEFWPLKKEPLELLALGGKRGDTLCLYRIQRQDDLQRFYHHQLPLASFSQR